MRPAERLSLALVVATVLAAVPIVQLTRDHSFLFLTAGLCASSALIAAIAGRLGASGSLRRVLYLVPGAAVIVVIGGNWPVLTASTSRFVIESWAPMAPHLGVTVFTSLLLWLIHVINESIAEGVGQPGWTFPGLVAPYLVPALILPGPSTPLWFATPAIGYLVILMAEARNRQPNPGPGQATTLAVATLAIGGLALGLTLGSAALVPDHGGSLRRPGGPDVVQLGDPSLDLVRNLQAPANTQLLQYTTSDGEGRYLRLAALPEFNANGFHLVQTQLVGLPFGTRPGTEGPTVTTTVSVGAFASEYLPLPWAPRGVQASGEWRYDPQTFAVVATGTGRTVATRQLTYTTTSVDQTTDPEEIAAAQGISPDDGLTLGLPTDLDPAIAELAREVSAEAETDGARVLALRDWLRSDEFTYTTQFTPGTTLDTLSDFLTASRTGYCEQFAGSLAVMARTLGIPSRVAIGFLPGTRDGETWTVGTRQMHAWTEVHLSDLGWVSLDPTPLGAGSGQPTPSASPSQSEQAPSRSPSTAPEPVPTPPTAPATPQEGTAPAALGWLALAGILLITPFTVRLARRQWRLRSTQSHSSLVENCWDEARDLVLDAALMWPRDTPRHTAAEVARMRPELTEPLTALANAVDHSRFAPPEAATSRSDLLGWVAAVEGELRADPWPGRWWPRSVFVGLKPDSR